MNSNTSTINNIVKAVTVNIKLDGADRYVGRLRTCTAAVYETKHWYILQSYTTIVAAIDKQTGILYDFLRYVYKYTATSAYHIRIFATDYHATQHYTYRP